MTNMRRVKVWFCVACLATSLAAPLQPTSLTLDILDVAAISRMSPQQLEELAEGLAAEEMMRTKRSSAQALTSVVSKASSGLQSKVGLLGQASAFISSASSKHGGDEHTGYSYEPHDEKVDFWGLKKSILFTLFQAVKAITGGVTILKGQLIKGGGHLAAKLGKVIAGKGDVVSNIGKKIVSSAALSSKKPHSTAVYGPPPPTHVEYPPSAYGAPTAPAHFSHTAPSAPSGYASHKYPAHLDGRGRLSGLHAGVVILTPLGDAATSESRPHGHTPLEPPPSILNSVYGAIKNAFIPAAATGPDHDYQAPHGFQPPQDYQPPHNYQPPHDYQPTHGYQQPHGSQPSHPPADITAPDHGYQPPPPPPETFPTFKPMTWGAVNSYGEPAQADTYPEYDPKNPYPPYATAKASFGLAKPSFGPAKLSSGPAKLSGPTSSVVLKKATPLTRDKIQKIKHNLAKVNALFSNDLLHRSSEVGFKFNAADVIRNRFSLPTPVVYDNEIGVLPAEFLPETSSTSTTEKPTSTTKKPTSTSQKPTEKTERKDVKYYLRGNRIVVHG